MKSKLIHLTYEVELTCDEKLTLPNTITESIGAGRWLITIQPLTQEDAIQSVRTHDAFLRGYAPEDEGLYDDCY